MTGFDHMHLIGTAQRVELGKVCHLNMYTDGAEARYKYKVPEVYTGMHGLSFTWSTKPTR